MGKNKKNIPSNPICEKAETKHGFTIIELLFIVAIIAILVSVILISLISSKNKANDNSAFTSFKTVASSAFLCITGSPVTTLNSPALSGGNYICSDPAVANNSGWPNFEKYGWTQFNWCDVNAPIETVPGTGNYGLDGGTYYGGNNLTGQLCFMLRNGSKLMWCTIEGCRKSGF